MRRPRTARLFLAALAAGGCAPLHSPLPEGAFIRHPAAPPALPPPAAPDPLPPAPPVPPRDPAAPLPLAEVLGSVQTHFPLLAAVEQERPIAGGNRLAAEGGFDPLVRVQGFDQGGTFSNARANASVEQAAPLGGVTSFAGWRLGDGNFPIYNNGFKTGDGGEFRAGLTLPLLQNRDIDPRRARLRAAQIAERLADPAIRRARLDFLRQAAQAYWAWQAAGATYRVAADVARLARDRQALLDAQLKNGQIKELPAVLNRRLLAGREEAVLAAERAVQAAAVRLSLFLRDPGGDPVVPAPAALLAGLIDLRPPDPDPGRLADDVAVAYARRPELERFRLEKERRAVELQLATNQQLPALNLTVAGAQDVGFSKKTLSGVGPFATDRTFGELGASLEVPIPFRGARGQAQAARGQLAQLLAQERYARDDIAAQVQDAASELHLTRQRLAQARQEQASAERVLALERVQRDVGNINLIELNILEIAAAEAQLRVVALVAQFFRGVADYLAAVGADPADPPPALGVLPAAAGPDLVGPCLPPR